MNMGRIDKYTMKYRDSIDSISCEIKDEDIVNRLNEIRQKEQDDEYNIYSHPQSGNIVVDAKLEGLDNYSFMVDTTLITNEMYPYDNQHPDGIESEKERVYFRYKCTAPKTTVLGWNQIVNEGLLTQYTKGTPEYDEHYNLLESTGIWKLLGDPSDTNNHNNPFNDKEGEKITVTRQLDLDDIIGNKYNLTDFDKDQAFNGAELRGVKITEDDIETAYPITYDNYEDLQIDICYVDQKTKKLKKLTEKLTQYNNFYKIIDKVANAEEYYNLNDYIQKIAGNVYLKITHNGETYWSDVKKEDVLLFCNNPFFNYNKESQSIELYFYSNNENGIRNAVTSDNLDAQQDEKLFTITTVPYSDICKYNNLKRSITLDINKVNSGLCYISNYTYTKDEDTMQIHMTLNNYAKDEGYVSHFFIEAFAPFENKSIFYDISPLVTDNHISFTLNPIITKDGEMVFTPADNGMLDINSNSSAELFIENGIDRSQIASGDIKEYSFSFSNSLSVEEKRFYILRFILFDENGGRITTILDGKGRVNDVRCLYTTGMFNDNTEQDFMDCLVREKVDEYGELEIVDGEVRVQESRDITNKNTCFSTQQNQLVYLKEDISKSIENQKVKCVVKNKNQHLFDIVNLTYKQYDRFKIVSDAHYAVRYGENNVDWGISYLPSFTYSLGPNEMDIINSFDNPTNVWDGLNRRIDISSVYDNINHIYSINLKDSFSLFTFGTTNTKKTFTNYLHPIFFEKRGIEWLLQHVIDNIDKDDSDIDISTRIKKYYLYPETTFDYYDIIKDYTEKVIDIMPKYIDGTLCKPLNDVKYNFKPEFRVIEFYKKGEKDAKTIYPSGAANLSRSYTVSKAEYNTNNLSFKLNYEKTYHLSLKLNNKQDRGIDLSSDLSQYIAKEQLPLFHFVTYRNGWSGSGGDTYDCTLESTYGDTGSEITMSSKFIPSRTMIVRNLLTVSTLKFNGWLALYKTIDYIKDIKIKQGRGGNYGANGNPRSSGAGVSETQSAYINESRIGSTIDCSMSLTANNSSINSEILLPIPISQARQTNWLYVDFPLVFLRLLILILSCIYVKYEDADSSDNYSDIFVCDTNNNVSSINYLNIPKICFLDFDTINPYTFYGTHFCFDNIKNLVNSSVKSAIVNSSKNILESKYLTTDLVYDYHNNFTFDVDGDLFNKTEKSSVFSSTYNNITTVASGNSDSDVFMFDSNGEMLNAKKSYVFLSGDVQLTLRLFNNLSNYKAGLTEIAYNTSICATILNLKYDTRYNKVYPVETPFDIKNFINGKFDGNNFLFNKQSVAVQNYKVTLAPAYSHLYDVARMPIEDSGFADFILNTPQAGETFGNYRYMRYNTAIPFNRTNLD